MTEESGDVGDGTVVVKADEVDQTGTAISTDASPENVPLPAGQTLKNTIRTVPLARPTLRRDGSAPPPPLQPPPPAPQLPENATDSLSLPQLKQLVSQFPKVEQTAYAFKYSDAQSFPEEIDEWFQYVEPERMMLISSKETFEQKWAEFCKSENSGENQDSDDCEVNWMNASHADQKKFLSTKLEDLRSSDVLIRIEASEIIFYILAGVWGLSAGLTPSQEQASGDDEEEDKLRYSRLQIDWIQKGTELLKECSGHFALFDYFQTIFFDIESSDPGLQTQPDGDDEGVSDFAQQREFTILLSSLYFIIEVARMQLDEHGMSDLRDDIVWLQPNLLVSLVQIISTLRWEEQSNIPLTKILLLFWKTLLLLFGNEEVLNCTKSVLQPKSDPFSADASHPILTASPLDYHLFRQEITSKYPAYNPPPPLVPLESEHKSILPPLPNHPSRTHNPTGPWPGAIGPADPNANSIFHQPVHIATPAPSPPPSPIGPGGKAGKKQNYQTNQNFPLLYPPLDDTSNKIGGKGSSNLQDTLVSKRWEGSDVPASIQEAGQLFASRMRMTRAMRQLWKERELSLKDDRGWLPKVSNKRKVDEEKDTSTDSKEGSPSDQPDTEDEAPDVECDDPEVQARLKIVEDFYHQSLPNMQSLIIVLLKTTLINVQAIAMQNGAPNSAGPDGGQQSGLPRNKSNLSLSQSMHFGASDMSLEELENIRMREICHKAISGALMVMLKWFKLSHVLKFEYLTQLLLDSSSIPLILKFFAHQDMENIVAQKNDRDDLNFFHFCHLNSDHPPLSPTSPLPEDEPSSPDDAAPPPILRHRRSPTSNSDGVRPPTPGKVDDPLEDQAASRVRPAVDELGNPLGPLPSEPITVFSWRNFFTSINFLRIMQKITRQKAHRCLLLVQYKSSTILRKNLKVPDPMLRLYTLKLFKSQVPYCGRKWRQSNMRVITAIYLHCRPELRDEWLAGMHDSQIEGEVDEALPLEQALRALTHWWHLRRYRDVMGSNDEEKLGAGEEMDEEELDFFTKELNVLGWGLAANSEDIAFGEDAEGRNGVAGATEHFEAGGPLQMEGW